MATARELITYRRVARIVLGANVRDRLRLQPSFPGKENHGGITAFRAIYHPQTVRKSDITMQLYHGGSLSRSRIAIAHRDCTALLESEIIFQLAELRI
jgi:hypothetical protein